MGIQDPVQKVMNFLRPEDLYYSASYLLFSSERSHEKEYETHLREAFKISNLSPLRFRIINKVIVLECLRYEITAVGYNYSDIQKPSFTPVFAPATYVIAVGEAPSKLSKSSLENKMYNFK